MEFSIKEKFEVAKQFLREVKTELKKVTWPSRKDTLSGTACRFSGCLHHCHLFGNCRFRPVESHQRVIEEGDKLKGVEISSSLNDNGRRLWHNNGMSSTPIRVSKIGPNRI